jgi:hypothetical protein
MTSIRKTLVLACAVSVLGLGTAFAQTDPNAAAPAAPAGGAMTAAPAAGDAAAPADASAMPKKMTKKHMSKKHMSKKKMM